MGGTFKPMKDKIAAMPDAGGARTKLPNAETAATNKGLAGIGGAMYSTKTGVI